MKTKELLKTLAPLSSINVSTAPMNDVKVNDRRIKVGDLSVNFNTNNLVMFGSALPIPVDYARRTPAKLMVPHVNHWLEQADPEAKLTILANDEGQITAATTREVVPYRPQELVKAITDTTRVDDWEVFGVTAEAFRFLAITERSVEPRVGDITKAGIEFSGSLFGLPPLQAALMSYRLVCSNGAIHSIHGGVLKFTGGGDDGLDGWVSKSIAAALDGAEHVFESLNEASNTPVDPEMLGNIDALLRQTRFPKRHRAMKKIADEKPETVYDLIQILTYTATHDTPGRTNLGVFYRGRQGQAIAGAMLGQLSSCDSCHQPILKVDDVVDTNGVEPDDDFDGETVEATVVKTKTKKTTAKPKTRGRRNGHYVEEE